MVKIEIQQGFRDPEAVAFPVLGTSNPSTVA
jgi:hypothetical protein